MSKALCKRGKKPGDSNWMLSLNFGLLELVSLHYIYNFTYGTGLVTGAVKINRDNAF